MRDPVQRPNASRYARGARTKAAARRADAGAVSAAPQPPAAGLASLPDLVAQKMDGFDAMRLEWAQIRDYTVATIQESLTDRRIPPENLTSPRLDIAVPALEAMRYSGLKKEFALLIAATMDISRTDEAHPAFIEILKQLTLDEANLLAALPATGQVVPMATLVHLDRSGHVKAALRHIIPGSLAMTCHRKSAIAGYIDNLTRLNLIASPPRLRIDDERLYRDLLGQAFVAAHRDRQPSHLKTSVEKEILLVTDFGSQFRNCCLDPLAGPLRPAAPA